MKLKSIFHPPTAHSFDINDAVKEARKYCLKNCEQMLDTGARIYRGFKYGQASTERFILLGDDMRNRASSDISNTLNYYTMLMSDILPAWKNYPKRSESYICSSSFSTAAKYGHLYMMIPFDDVEIAIAPTDDLWGSFYGNFSKICGEDTLEHFNEVLLELIVYLVPAYGRHIGGNKSIARFSDRTSIKNAIATPAQLEFALKAATVSLKKMKKRELENDIEIRGELNDGMEMAMNIKEKYGSDILKALNDVMSPVNNNFHLELLSNLTWNRDADREIWFSGKCFALSFDIQQSVIAFQQMREFLEEVVNG